MVNVKRVAASSFPRDKDFYTILNNYKGLQECKSFLFGIILKQNVLQLAEIIV